MNTENDLTDSKEYATYTDETGTYIDLSGYYNIGDNDIDINDYIPADEENTEFGNYTIVLNIFLCYFKQLYSREQKETMFDHIDYKQENSTNRCMESMYEEILKFNISKDDDKDILYNPNDSSIENIDIDKCDELYSLYIKDEPKHVCKYLMPLVKYISTLNWASIEWAIIKLK